MAKSNNNNNSSNDVIRPVVSVEVAAQPTTSVNSLVDAREQEYQSADLEDKAISVVMYKQRQNVQAKISEVGKIVAKLAGELTVARKDLEDAVAAAIRSRRAELQARIPGGGVSELVAAWFGLSDKDAHLHVEAKASALEVKAARADWVEARNSATLSLVEFKIVGDIAARVFRTTFTVKGARWVTETVFPDSLIELAVNVEAIAASRAEAESANTELLQLAAQLSAKEADMRHEFNERRIKKSKLPEAEAVQALIAKRIEDGQRALPDITALGKRLAAPKKK